MSVCVCVCLSGRLAGWTLKLVDARETRTPLLAGLIKRKKEEKSPTSCGRRSDFYTTKQAEMWTVETVSWRSERSVMSSTSFDFFIFLFSFFLSPLRQPFGCCWWAKCSRVWLKWNQKNKYHSKNESKQNGPSTARYGQSNFGGEKKNRLTNLFFFIWSRN